MESKNNLIIQVIIALFIFLVSFSLGSIFGGRIFLEHGITQKFNGPVPQAIISECNNKSLNNTKEEPKNTIFGIVQSVNGNFVTIKKSDNKIVTVEINSSTKLFVETPNVNGGESVKKESSISDVKIEDMFTVKSDKDIRNSDLFTAIEVSFLHKPDLSKISK